jgi:hypothetical protein
VKFAAASLSGLLLLVTIAAHAQDPTKTQGTVQHVIVVVQENRTVDNLFGSGSNPPFESGVNIASSGNVEGGSSVPLSAVTLYGCYDLGHTHADFTAMYDSGNMDGADNESVHPSSGCIPGSNPPYRYADNSSTTLPANEVAPYFAIAKEFGFANYMFQTNQGPSFPAHQFIFSGTSAPVYDDGDSGQYWEWFAAENPQLNGAGIGTPTGCLGEVAPYLNTVQQINPGGTESNGWSNPSLFSGTNGAGYPCYNHNTIATVLDPAGITWKYYTNDPRSIWTAPNAIQGICNPSAAGGPCSTAPGSDWNNVIVQSTVNGHPAQILEDIKNCALPKVAFVTPDGAWSDHAGCATGTNCNTQALGPSWVAAIVNGIGQGMTGSTCNTASNPVYWNNTVILITWDDWGGWYDHVLPPSASGYFGGGTNGEQYTYGFRVPLLVVSAYSPKAGYVSGATSTLATECPSTPNRKYCHDFGSILNFIEYAFGSNGAPLGQIGSIDYPYADYFAMDGANVCGIQCPYSLSDFFKFSQTPATFTAIPAPYLSSFFLKYTGNPQEPDNDGD